MVEQVQDESEAAFKFIDKVHNCPAVWDVSSVAYKDTKYKQKTMEELAEKLGLFQTFPLFLYLFLFLLFSSSVSMFNVLSFDASLTCEGTSLPTF